MPALNASEPVPNPLEGLAEAWERNHDLRKQIQDEIALVFWPETKLVGIISMQALKVNVDLLNNAASLWVPKQTTPKTLPVGWLKVEAWGCACRWLRFLQCDGVTCSG